MTDYLDELLEQQEVEEEKGLEWRRPGLAVRNAERLREDEAEQAALYLQEQGQREGTGTTVKTVRALTLQLEQLRRTVRRTQTLTERRVQPARQSVPGVDGASLGGRMSRERTVNYARLLDVAFQRDARRYDGPLGLL